MPSILMLVLPLSKVELAGLGNQSRFVASFDKVAHDFEVRHVLAGGKFGSRCGD